MISACITPIIFFKLIVLSKFGRPSLIALTILYIFDGEKMIIACRVIAFIIDTEKTLMTTICYHCLLYFSVLMSEKASPRISETHWFYIECVIVFVVEIFFWLLCHTSPMFCLPFQKRECSSREKQMLVTNKSVR